MNSQIQNILRTIKYLIRQDEPRRIKDIMEKLHPADIAEILRLLNERQREAAFEYLDSEKAASVIRELDTASEHDLIYRLNSIELSQILEEMPADDAADILSELPEEQVEKLLSLMEAEESERVQKLLGYEPDTAGGIMTTNYLALNKNTTVNDTIEGIRKLEKGEPYRDIFITDEDNVLLGTIAMEDLITNQGNANLEKIMQSEIIKVEPEMDQEEVARIVTKYDLASLPVVDDRGHLLGIITFDDVMDVINEEATEDIYLMAGTEGEELFTKSVFQIATIRLPWLLITLMGGLIASLIIKTYGQYITQSIWIGISAFIPIMMGMGGNIGVQSATIVVRGIATGTIDYSQLWKVLSREMLVGAVMGFTCGTVSGLAAQIILGDYRLGIIVGISMFLAIMVAALMGVIIPLIFKRLSIDPAIASGPFVTTANDITGLIIYFTLVIELSHFLLL